MCIKKQSLPILCYTDDKGEEKKKRNKEKEKER